MYIPYDPSRPLHRKDRTQPSQNRYISSPLALHDKVHEVPPPSNLQQSQPVGRGLELTEQVLHPYNTPAGGISSTGAAAVWPLDRVLQWLAHNSFSNEWQETFKSLELQGADFLELGHRSNGRPNFGKLHEEVYPQLAKECRKSATGWDAARGREEGKRLRKLIRQIHDEGDQEAGMPTSRRLDFHQQPQSASVPSECGSELSPVLVHEPVAVEGSSGVQAGFPHRYSGGGGVTAGQARAVTLPVASSQVPAVESTVNEPVSWSRLRASSADHQQHRRQSPSISSDGGSPFPAYPGRPAEESPQSDSPAVQQAFFGYSGLPPLSTTAMEPSMRYEHARGSSADSTVGLGRSHAVSSGRYYEHRKYSQARPPEAAPPRIPGNEYSKEPGRGFLTSFFKRGKPTRDPTHTSPEDHGSESPTSPMYTRQHNLFRTPDYNGSDGSLVTAASSDMTSARARTAQKTKKWIFVTADLLNYRLVDTTDIDSVDTLRTVICSNVGIPDYASVQVFLTEPGQSDHDEPLNDTALWIYQARKADPSGSLKLYVRGTHSSHISLSNLPHTAPALGIPVPGRFTPSPTIGPVQRKPLGDEAISRISNQAQNPSPSSPLNSRLPTFTSHSLQQTPRGGSPVPPPAIPAGDGASEAVQVLGPERADLLARHEEHQRDVERKQKAYRISKLPPPSQPNKSDLYGDTGYRRDGIIDFDIPRHSPFDGGEKTSTGTLIPRRKPPSAPPESSTLTKVNSLSKKPVDRTQQHSGSALGAASISNPSASVPESRSEGSDPHSNPDTTRNAVPHASQGTAPGLSRHIAIDPCLVDSRPLTTTKTAPEPRKADVTAKKISSSSIKKSHGKPQRWQSRKSYGPEFEFQEAEVSFITSPVRKEDSDEESDDGLFAIPLANNNKPEEKEETNPSLPAETSERAESPSLSGENEPGKNAEGESNPAATNTLPPGSTTSDVREKDGRSQPPSSMRRGPVRRDSFAGGDVWANRPPVEGVIENLDEFFPDIDLDAPYLEGNQGSSPPSSPASKAAAAPNESTSKGKVEQPGHSLQRSSNVTDTFAPDESTLKGTDDGGTAVARRNVNRSGGLSRMKSIREVAKGANQTQRNRSVHATGNQKNSVLLRRKSTKMFGAKIMQIRPRPGTRLSSLEPIPQNNAPSQGSQPQRQPTFRILRGQLIGKGTYGRVYLGMNADNGEVIAVKQVDIHTRGAIHDKDRMKEMVAALDQEIDTMQHLEHPNIVQYLGCERGEASISIYLEYISGGSIGSCLRKHGEFEESVVKSLTRQTLSGLAYLHDQGILHRDMKADNILLDLDGTCKISDFGISKKSDNIYGNDSSNSMQGSVFWMAPEVIRSQGQGYSAKVDIWSLGCLVLEMFAGRRPWSREEAIGAIFKLGSLNQAPPIPDNVSMKISPEALAFMYDCFTM